MDGSNMPYFANSLRCSDFLPFGGTSYHPTKNN